LIRAAAGTGWLLDELDRLCAKYDVSEIVADGYGGTYPWRSSSAMPG
jgi:hypothetical protein